MMLRERWAVADAALPLAEFRDHLQLGSGFSDVGAEDAALIAYLRAAIAAIEGRTAKVLISRGITLTLSHWRGRDGQPLPLAPVSVIEAVRVIDDAGTVTLDAAGYRLLRDGIRPRVVGLALEPQFGRQIEIDFTAGFGAEWSGVPADLRQAVMLLAAQYYELRHDGAGEAGAMPFGVMALIERWRTVRMLGGQG